MFDITAINFAKYVMIDKYNQAELSVTNLVCY